MIAKQVIEKKKDGKALGTGEIREFVDGFTRGSIPDYQMSALAMAICCRGMTVRETADLTDSMMRSGVMLEWGGDGLPTADKHSTGGVGDKLSFVIQPLAAACGLRVPSLVGRGLGLTGGTADKIESIPGYDASLTLERLRGVVDGVGVSMACQTAEICPADKKLYALRDVTGTVASIPLITASILSKKLAEGAGTLVFDVKCGSGAFMRSLDEARALASSLVAGAKEAGRGASALVTDMDAPLGYAVGNANEVEEAMEIMSHPPRGTRHEDVAALCVEFAARMVSLAKGVGMDDARTLAWQRLDDGSALAKFREMVAAQGGDLEAFAKKRATRRVHRWKISAMKSGYIQRIDAAGVALAALELGAGRAKEGDTIDFDAGISLAVRRGDRVAVGAELATLETATRQDELERAAAALYKAFEISPTPTPPPNLIIEELS